MMKKASFFLIMLALCATARAQSVAGAAGGDSEAATWTVGEVFTTSVLRSNVVRISQGFNQPLAVEASGVLAVEADRLSFTAWPNPVVDELQLRFADGTACEWSLYDVNGAQLRTGSSATGDARIDFSQAATGEYVLRVTTSAGSRAVNIVKR